MGVVEDFEAEIQRQFEEWATTTCPAALVKAIDANTITRTGDLKKSVDYTKVDKKTYHVGVRASYGGYVDQGRGPVRPKGKGYPLHWTTPEGKDVFSYYAGPSRPRHFIADAVSNVGN